MLEGANIKLSGTVKDINGKSARNLLEYLLTGESFDGAKYDEMYEQNIIVHNLKVTKKQIIDDLNGVMTLTKEEEKQASQAIRSVTGVGNTSAQAVISVIGTDMERFPTDAHISSWAGLCPGDNESAKKRKSGKTRKGNSLLRSTLITCAHSAVKNLILRTVYEDQRPLREEARIRCSCPFYAYSHLSHS